MGGLVNLWRSRAVSFPERPVRDWDIYALTKSTAEASSLPPAFNRPRKCSKLLGLVTSYECCSSSTSGLMSASVALAAAVLVRPAWWCVCVM